MHSCAKKVNGRTKYAWKTLKLPRNWNWEKESSAKPAYVFIERATALSEKFKCGKVCASFVCALCAWLRYVVAIHLAVDKTRRNKPQWLPLTSYNPRHIEHTHFPIPSTSFAKSLFAKIYLPDEKSTLDSIFAANEACWWLYFAICSMYSSALFGSLPSDLQRK